MYRQRVTADGTPARLECAGRRDHLQPGLATFDGTNTYVFARGGDGVVYYRSLHRRATAGLDRPRWLLQPRIRIRSTTAPGSGSW